MAVWSVVSVYLVVFSGCLLFLYLFTDRRKKRYPRGPWGMPVVGHLPFLGKYPAKTFQKWRQKYGNIFSMRTGSWDTVVLNGYDVIKAAADFEGDVFSDRINFTTFNVQKAVNDGVYTLTTAPFDQVYLQARKTASRAIGAMTKIQSPAFVEFISSTAKSFYSNILSKSESGVLCLDADVHLAIGTIAYKVIYGRGHDSSKVDNQIDVIMNLCHETLKVQGCGNPADVLPWFKYFIPFKMARLEDVFKIFHQVGVAEIEAHKRTFVEDQVGDITDYFIDYKRRQKAKAGTISDPVCTLLFNGLKEMYAAGFETSCTTLKWLILYMIAYPEVQEKVQSEIDTVVGAARDVDLADRHSLHYTMAVVHEVMRMCTIVPFAIPHKTLRDTEFMGYNIDKGTYIVFNLHSINHEKIYWGDPESFRPERLLDDKGHLDRQKCSRIVPFSLGRRRCVGERLARMQVFILFAVLLQHCGLSKPRNDVIDMSPKPNLIYAPKPYGVIVESRHNKTL